MKYLLFSLMFACSMNAQTTIHFYYAPIEQTTGAEVLIPVRNTSISLGGGFSGAWDVHKGSPEKEEWCSLYSTASTGYLGDFLIKYKAGICTYIKSEIVSYKPLIGVSAMYSINDYFGVEIGYDTFNKATIGVVAKF